MKTKKNDSIHAQPHSIEEGENLDQKKQLEETRKLQKPERREFLSKTGLSLAAGALSFSTLRNTSLAATETEMKAKKSPYLRFLDPQANIGELTESARHMCSRDQLLKKALDKIPEPDRVEQIFSVISRHVEAEEAGDVGATLATMVSDPIFENIPEGLTYRGHKSVAEDYSRRYFGLSRKLHLTNLTVDREGAVAEMLWEGLQINNYHDVKPVKNPKRFYIPMIVYYEVTDQGLIKRESVYYDQYLGALSLELIPDIFASRLRMISLNPGLLARKV